MKRERGMSWFRRIVADRIHGLARPDSSALTDQLLLEVKALAVGGDEAASWLLDSCMREGLRRVVTDTIKATGRQAIRTLTGRGSMPTRVGVRVRPGAGGAATFQFPLLLDMTRMQLEAVRDVLETNFRQMTVERDTVRALSDLLARSPEALTAREAAVSAGFDPELLDLPAIQAYLKDPPPGQPDARDATGEDSGGG